MRINLASCKWTLFWLSAIYTLSLGIILMGLSDHWLPWWLVLFSVLGWAASAYREISRHATRTAATAVVAVAWLPALAQWQVQLRRGDWLEVTLSGRSLITSQILLLNFKQQDRFLPITVWVGKDTLSVSAMKQLRRSIRCYDSVGIS